MTRPSRPPQGLTNAAASPVPETNNERTHPPGFTIDDLIAEPPAPQYRLRRMPRLLIRAIVLTWSSGKRQFVILAAVQVVQGALVALQVLLTKELLTVVQHHGSAGEAVRSMLPVLGIFIVMFTAARFGGTLQNGQTELLHELVTNKARRRVLDVAGKVDLLSFEDSSFHDRLQRASQSASFRSLEMVEALFSLFGSAARVVGLLVAIAVLNPLLLIPLVFAYVPLWFASQRSGNDVYQFIYGMTPLERERNYMNRLLTDRHTATEVRAYGLLDYLAGRYDALSAQHVAGRRAVIGRRMRRQLALSLQSTLLMAGTVCLLSWFYASGRLGIAAAGAALAAILQFSGALSGVGNGSGGLYQSSLFVNDYVSFVSEETTPAPHPGHKPVPGRFRDLEVDHISFAYPDSPAPALQDVSLRIRAGEVVALVGENGSGKTTLAKLLAGLYRPASGRILWDGVDTAEYDLAGLRQSIAIVFQDFIHYHLTGRENVGLGRCERLGDEAALAAATRLAGADAVFAALPLGLDTLLGKEFLGGHDLSVGQWQRVALARAFFRDAPFVVLDEPTASLDVRAEQDVFERVRAQLQGRAVLLISHRFGTVRSADHIYVLRSGRVAEHGNHDSLMAAGGIYAELFGLQAAAYAGEA